MLARSNRKVGGRRRPSTGAMIVDFVCNYVVPSRLLVVGFDFKKTKSVHSSRQRLGPHDWDAERIYTQELLQAGVLDCLDWSIL